VAAPDALLVVEVEVEAVAGTKERHIWRNTVPAGTGIATFF
jgi:hypothetical protein